MILQSNYPGKKHNRRESIFLQHCLAQGENVSKNVLIRSLHSLIDRQLTLKNETISKILTKCCREIFMRPYAASPKIIGNGF